MRKLNQTGSLVLPLVIVVVLFLGAAGFGVWAFAGRQDYKNNSDQKAAVAAAAATKAEAAKKDAEAVEAAKLPSRSYTGPATYGGVTFQFPKSWNEYITTPSQGLIVDNYYGTSFVQDVAAGTPYVLRAQISGTDYATLLKAYDNAVKAGTVSVTAFRAAKVPSVLGAMLTGAINQKNTGTMVMLPIRDKTLILWTEGTDGQADFTNTVLPSISFSP